ncbi:MAG: TSUP family transporter [Candidatus Delongbacteria bacterium]|nr:TSUP family transporter [Candidatus Delongbacteria bacterium]
MNPAVLTFAAVAAIITAASVIQSSVGFAFALFSTPLLLWTGIPLPQVITIVAVCSFVQALIGARHLRDSLPWRLALTASLVRIVTIVAGLMILKSLVGLEAGSIRALVGGILCLLVGVQLIFRVQPVATVHWFWSGLAFSSSGLLVGICGMGGPPLVIWTLAHDWTAARIRGFLFVVFAVTIPFQIILLNLFFGAEIFKTALYALSLSPFVLLGALIGLPIGNRLPEPLLRWTMYLILLVIGLSAIIPAIV